MMGNARFAGNIRPERRSTVAAARLDPTRDCEHPVEEEEPVADTAEQPEPPNLMPPPLPSLPSEHRKGDGEYHVASMRNSHVDL